MATAYTSLLGLALPVTGELSGNWGNAVNTEITALLDSAVAGTTSITVDADITLTTTTGAANTSRQAIILWNPAAGTTTRNITAPAQSKVYVVINASGGTQSIVLRGAGPTTGVTIAQGEKAVCAWNGTDFIKISSAFTGATTGTGALVFATSPTLITPALGTPSALVGTNITGTATAFTASNVTTNANLTGAVTSTGNATLLGSFSSANLSGALTDETGSGSAVFATSPTLVTPALGTPSSGVVTNLTGTASININGTVGATTASTGAFTTLSATGVTTVQAGTAALPAITTTGDTNTGIFFPAADTIAFTEGGVEAMRIDSSGNVGIGTNSPDALLTLNKASGAADIRLKIGSTLYGNIYASTSDFTINSISAIPLTFGTNNTERMRIDSSGNVGIGTSSPNARLHVFQDSASTSVMSGAYIQNLSHSVNTQAGIGFFAYDNFNAKIYTLRSGSSSGSLIFATNNGAGTGESNVAERMRIDSSGNLLVGKTSVAAFTTQGVEIIPSSTAANLAVTSTSASNYDMVRLTRTGTSGIMIGFFNGTSRVGDVSIGASSTSYTTSSDYRLKEAIAPMQGALARVAALKPVTYKWKIDGSDGQGFIAHELQAVVPNCVTGEKDAVDSDGKPQYQGIDTSFLVATLTAAIQEQQALITALTTRITALEST